MNRAPAPAPAPRSPAPAHEAAAAPPAVAGALVPDGVAAPRLTPTTILGLQRVIGNRAVGRLVRPARTEGAAAAPAAPSVAAAPRGVVQRVPGDGLVALRDTPLYERKNPNSGQVEQIAANQVCLELVPPSARWTKVRVAATESVGWVMVADFRTEETLYQPERARAEEFDLPTHVAEAQGKLFEGDPSSDDVGQGGLGDCWLLGPLAAIADTQHGKALLREMIRDNRNDTFTVRFFIPRVPDSDEVEERTVTVDRVVPTTPGGDPLYAQQTDTGAVWPLVVEKAYAQVKGSFYAISGGMVSDAYLVLTGRRPEGFSHEARNDGVDAAQPLELEALRDRLRAIGDRAVTVSVPPEPYQASLTFIPMEGEFAGEYSSVIPKLGVRESTISLEYPAASGKQVRKWGRAGGVHLTELKDDELTMVSFVPKPGEQPAEGNLQVQVGAQVTDLGGISGGHIYLVHEFDDQNDQVVLLDPHDTSETVSVETEELFVTHRAAVYFERT